MDFPLLPGGEGAAWVRGASLREALPEPACRERPGDGSWLLNFRSCAWLGLRLTGQQDHTALLGVRHLSIPRRQSVLSGMQRDVEPHLQKHKHDQQHDGRVEQ